MYIVIMGSGRLGSQLADQLSTKEHDVVVIDQNPAAFDALGSGFNGLTVTGTGIDIDVQKKAGVDRADAFAALSSDDNTNIMAAQVAKEVFRVPRVIARIYDPKREYAYHQLGLESICPTNIGADIVRNYIESDGLCCRLNCSDSEIVEFTASKPMLGRKIQEIDLPGSVRIVMVTRDGKQYVAGPDWLVQDGDVLMAAIDGAYRQEFKQLWLSKSDWSIQKFRERSRR